MIRRLYYLAFVVSLSGCGGGGGGTPTTTAATTLTGVVAASAPFTSGNVYVYDFSNGSKGALLQSAPIGVNGGYSMTIASPPAYILVAATGCYVETVYLYDGAVPQPVAPNSSSVPANPVCLNIPINAVVSLNPGTSVSVAVTPYTDAAYGLTQYDLAHGQTIAAAVADGNTRVSQVAGVNVITTMPVYPTQTGTPGAGTEYGGLLGGIASWLYNVPYFNQTGVVAPVGTSGLTSVNIAEAMRNDLAHDGVLDGVGSDTNGNAYVLAVANTPLTTAVYRHQFAKYAVIALRGAFENLPSATLADLTRIDGFFPALVAYNNATSLFDASAPVPLDEGGPIVAIAAPTAGATLTGSAGIDGTTKDITGVVQGSSDLLIDGVHYDNFLDPYHPNHFINTTVFTNGTHTLTIRATNNLGTTNSVSVIVTFTN